MKKTKQIFIIMTTTVLFLSGTVSAHGLTYINDMRATAKYINGVPTSDPVPKLDKGMSSPTLSRAGANPTVTDPAVSLYTTGGNYYAKGYVTMKVGKNDFYHYTRAEV